MVPRRERGAGESSSGGARELPRFPDPCGLLQRPRGGGRGDPQPHSPAAPCPAAVGARLLLGRGSTLRARAQRTAAPWSEASRAGALPRAPPPPSAPNLTRPRSQPSRSPGPGTSAHPRFPRTRCTEYPRQRHSAPALDSTRPGHLLLSARPLPGNTFVQLCISLSQTLLCNSRYASQLTPCGL